MSDTSDNSRIHLALASGSPRRMELLRQLGLNYVLLDHGLEEETAVQDESPQTYVRRLAVTKAMIARKTIIEYDKKGPAARAILNIGEKLAQQLKMTSQTTRRTAYAAS